MRLNWLTLTAGAAAVVLVTGLMLTWPRVKRTAWLLRQAVREGHVYYTSRVNTPEGVKRVDVQLWPPTNSEPGRRPD